MKIEINPDSRDRYIGDYKKDSCIISYPHLLLMEDPSKVYWLFGHYLESWSYSTEGHPSAKTVSLSNKKMKLK